MGPYSWTVGSQQAAASVIRSEGVPTSTHDAKFHLEININSKKYSNVEQTILKSLANPQH